MPEQPLKVGLEVTDQHSCQYTLTFDSSQYPVTLTPERNVTVSEWLRRLRPVLVGNNDPAGSRDPQDLMRNVGTWLWQALLPESAPTREREALVRALCTGRTPLVFALPDTLAELPWELLCDPDQAGDRGFLARRRPLIRLIASENESAVSPITPPLRVLLLISSPLSLGEHARIDVESERAAVEQATYEMRRTGRLHLRTEDIVTKERVQEALITFDPHIVHYIGHGAYDEHIGGSLLWEDKQGNEEHLSAADLAEMLYSQNVCAVVLHACETGRSNTRTDVSGIAGKLVKEGIPAVLAQQANFTYESSQQASKTWYTALAANRGFAQALFEVRRALAQTDRPDWAVPILQANPSSLGPLLDTNASPGSPDPLLTNVGAVTDLPTPTGVFVGRHRELRALRLLLENVPGSGPVMALITGPGGIGKSILVAQAVTHYGRMYKAVLTLRCQGYQGVDLFLQRIGEFLKRLGTPSFLDLYLPDPKLSTEAKIEEAIIALNAAGPLLLVIDNLESVQNKDQTISDEGLLSLLQKLLTNLRRGRVLITGRYTVKDLLPQGKFAANLRHLDLNDLSLYETNQLLLRHPTLAVLGEVVRQKLVGEFGGLPYVYDLLSSKAASQDLEALIHDVQGRITEEHKRLTTEEWQKVRRQVIEFAALEATVHHLSEASRVLLAQLSVLYQSFPLAAIEKGLGASRSAWQPLLDWSLLHYDLHEKTYHLHSLTRHYAEGLLEEQTRKQAQVQLATWYERYAERESHGLADYLEAHRLWRMAGRMQQAGELAMRFAERLKQFGLYILLQDLCTKILGDVPESDELLVAYALLHLGHLAHLQGAYKEVRGLYQQSLSIFERLGSLLGQADVSHLWGAIAQDQGEYGEARDLYQRSLDLYVQLEEPLGQANSLVLLGLLAEKQGEYQEARDLYQRSLDLYVQLEEPLGQAKSLHALGHLAYLQEELEEARGFFQQGLDLYERLADQGGRATILRDLGNLAYSQGELEEARGFYQQSLDLFERLGHPLGQAISLHNLGNLAYSQGELEEARGLYRQSLDIAERLGDVGWRASSLYQLGLVAYEQGDFENALTCTIQAYTIFEALRSPSRVLAQSLIAKISSNIDEETFTTQWQVLAGNYPLPTLPREDIRQSYLQVIIDFIKVPTWSEAKSFLEAHPELLLPALDPLLQAAVAQQEQDGIRDTIEEHRLLLALCRDKGIDAAFAEIQAAQHPAVAFAADLDRLCNEVIATLRSGNTEQKGALAIQIEQILKNYPPIEDAQNFLIVLIAWLREQDTQLLAEMLQAPFREAFSQMVVAVEQEETDDTEDDRLTFEELLDIVSYAILHGTAEQRQQLAADFIEKLQLLPSEAAPLGRFLGCLVASLRGKRPEVELLEAPFTELWQAFQDAMSVPPDKPS